LVVLLESRQWVRFNRVYFHNSWSHHMESIWFWSGFLLLKSQTNCKNIWK
jgi:hypothetical protein